MRRTPLEAWICQKMGRPEQEFSRQALEAYQLAQLRKTLGMAQQKSSFYRRRLAGLSSEIQSLEEFQSYPFVTAEDIRCDALQMICVSQSEINRVVTLDTSGTSGPPKRLFFTRADQELTIDFFGVGMSSLVNPDDRVLILLPGELPGSVGDLLHLGLSRTGVFSLKHGPVKDPQAVLRQIQQEHITALVGVPVQVLALAYTWAADHSEKPCPIHRVLLSTDAAPCSLVKVLRDIWDCEVYQHYGMTEMGLGGGVSCEAQRGYHLREADLYFEVVHPGSGLPVAEGEMGEVVFTTLTREGMPLIRYRTGDLGRFLSGACDCGSGLKTLDFIHERMGSRVELGGGALALSDLDEVLFGLPGVADFNARVEQTQLSLTVFVFPGYQTSRDEVAAAVRSIPAVSRVGLSIECIPGLPPDLGKMSKRTIIFHILRKIAEEIKNV